MHQSDQLKIIFVINPRSGGKQKYDWEKEIKKFFDTNCHEIEFFHLGGQNDIDLLKQLIKVFEPDRVVAVGGDGTISFTAKGIIGTEIALGILPAGSANGLAKELEIPSTPGEGLDLILHGTKRKADVIRINDEYYCLHLSDLGLNAQLIKHFEAENTRGKFGYAKIVTRLIFRRKPRMSVSIGKNNSELQRFAFMVVLANATKYGTGAVINPEGSLYDGLFEVVVIRKLAVFEILKSLFKPERFDPKKFELFHTTDVCIKTKRRAHFQVDGEYIGKVSEINAVIMPGLLNIITAPPKEKNKGKADH
jgi:diacylglycerol kinase (ATP)